MKKVFLAVSLAATVLVFNHCARNPVTGKKQVVFMSEEQEIAMGKEADPQIIAQFGLYEDSALQRFLTEKGKQMAAISHRPNLDYQFRVVNSEVINAFAVPGGYVYFTRGIMAHFNNEAEMAGVLGHEIGHITARHSVAQQRNQILGQLGIIAGIIINPKLGQFAEAASQGVGLLLLKFGRDAERQSDELGVEYSTKINYDAQQMSTFFQTLQRQGEKSGSNELPGFLSTHPDPGERTVTVAKLATEWKQKLNVTNPQVNRDSYLRRIEGLVYGEDPREGYLENNVFYHPVLRFQFATPANWAYLNSPQSVQMAPKDGKALMFLTLGRGKSVEEAANAILQQYKLQAVDSRKVQVNGLEALAMIADQVQEQGTLRTLSYLIKYGENIYLILGVSALPDFPNYESYFINTMQSFRELNDASKINKKPQRIRIQTVRQGGNLGQVLRSFNMPENKLEELSLLNGMKLTDMVTQGMLIKVLGE
ncbi:MAG TPA: M48 family metalloprotease [Chitinophagaceae bacterium]